MHVERVVYPRFIPIQFASNDSPAVSVTDTVGEFRGGGPEVFEGPESCSRSDFLAGFRTASDRVADFANSIRYYPDPLFCSDSYVV
jgi:hypothetical protein